MRSDLFYRIISNVYDLLDVIYFRVDVVIAIAYVVITSKNKPAALNNSSPHTNYNSK